MSECKPRWARAQALLELALCAPVVILLALGTVAAVQVATARAGLDAATQAAANAAVRAPDAAGAAAAAHMRFSSVIAAYPVHSTRLVVETGGFERTGLITVSSSADIDLAWAVFVLLPSHVTLQSQVVLRLEPWRTHHLP
jgi:Flp pilus assembly protein TadG